MVMNKIAMAAVFGIIAAHVCDAGVTYYVDKSGSESYNGRSAVFDGVNGPKALIQSAVDLAQDGDTVSVAAGVYGAEQGSVPRTDDCHAYRIRIPKTFRLLPRPGATRL